MNTQLTMAPNLALDETIVRRRAAGEALVHLGFGESRLPVFPGLVQALLAGSRRTAYGPVAGDAAVREAAAGYFARRSLPTDPDQIAVAPGSKPLLAASIAALERDVILPRPCWLTYEPQARLFARRSSWVPVPEACGGVPDPAALTEVVRRARQEGRSPGLLVLTLPDNPTGTFAPPALVREVCAAAEREDLFIISDEIYRDVVHDPAARFLSPAEVVPERTIVTSGLSKNLALGGWRIGFARFPASAGGRRIRARVTAVASEVWSSLAGPMQEAAAYALAEPPELCEYVRRSTRLHGAVARAVHRLLVAAGASCRAPTGGFYVYPDLERCRETLAARGVRDSASLEHVLLEELGVAVLGGHHFGDQPDRLRFRAATSLLYGETDEERREALHAEDPLHLPAIAGALAHIQRAFARLLS